MGPLPDGGCQPESDAQLCASNSRPCGALQATDSCGTARLVICGQCTQAGGVPLLDAGTGTLTCIRGALEPGRPASPFAFEMVRQHATVDFLHRGLTDAGLPVLPVVLDLPLAYPYPVPALFTLVGDAGATTLTQLAESAMTTVAPGANAALRLGSRLAVDADASSPRLAVGGLPPMLWYARCSGVADLSPPETDSAFCQANGFSCASVTATDNTGTLRTAVCGPCQGGQVCRPSTASGWPSMQCRQCNVESDAQFCNRLGKDCGSVTALDDCDVMRTANCGACSMPSICGSTNVCGGGSVTCMYYRNTQPSGSPSCDFGDAGINSVQTQTFTQLSFVWNPMRARYQHTTTVPSIILGGVLELYLYSATDTNVSWSEGATIGTRSGNVITVSGQASRQSPPGCPNQTIHTSCVGAAPFVFVP